MLGPPSVKQHFQALLRAHLEMKLTLWANKEIFFQVFTERNGAAIFAFGPQTFGADTSLFGRRRLGNRLFLSLEPSHFAFFFLCHGVDPSGRSGPSLQQQFNSLYHAARECPWCRGASLPSSRSLDRPAPPALDARCVRCKSHVRVRDGRRARPQ